MNNLRTSLSLALIAKRDFACVTNDYEQCVHLVVSFLRSYDDSLTFTEIDILKGYRDLASEMTYNTSSNVSVLHNIVIWKNLEGLQLDLVAKSGLLEAFNQLNRYYTVEASRTPCHTPIDFQGTKVLKPEIFLIIPVMQLGLTMPKIDNLIKERFWFCQSVFFEANQRPNIEPWDWDLEECQNTLPRVFFDPEVREYVSSLMVFTRSHRLTSIAPLTSRPTFNATVAIIDLAKALVVWNNRYSHDRLFVTPDYVKVAYRKVCYWLVDWETNKTFISESKEAEHEKRMQISILTGDWYGSEWHCVKSFLKEFESTQDPKTTTGFRNKIVDDVLESVLPPIWAIYVRCRLAYCDYHSEVGSEVRIVANRINDFIASSLDDLRPTWHWLSLI